MATLTELLAQKAELEKKIIETQREEKTQAIAQVKTLMAQYGLTIADLGTRAPAPTRAGSTGRKVAAKYRDPATGDTWSGRGLQPKWLRAALAAGRSLADFAL
ncbi:MAG: histone family protein nucleoid-structuring protein H-NS [Rubrivivax sp. SCN 70-15]|nr:MAG: histone family protein nucleoid-structuring protein H-NS [Rubrivivax sp. SCN 70-15]